MEYYCNFGCTAIITGWLTVIVFLLLAAMRVFSTCYFCHPNRETARTPDDQDRHIQHQIFGNLELTPSIMDMVAVDRQQASLPAPPAYDEGRAKEIAAGCTECVICLGEYGGEGDDGGEGHLRTLKPCGHRFHTACIVAWFEKQRWCPICRSACVR